MTDREKQIINLIKENPLITQEEIAATLNCARTSIAVHISNLMKKGIILGKKYIINEEPYVLIIGGTNIDIQGKSESNIVRYDSNPGQIEISYGGVAKNIAENTSKLGLNSKLITALGNDLYGKSIASYLREQGLDIMDSLILDNEQTAMYVSILNDDSEMEMAVSSMDICEHITPTYLESLKKKIMNAGLLVVDTNLSEETLKYIANFRKKPNVILDTVSTKKAMKVKDFIGKFHTIKPNKLEAEALSGIQIYGNDDLKRAGEYFIEKGVKNVFISLGSKGVFYMSDKENDYGIVKPPKISTVSVNGAGDAFVSMLAYGEYHGFSAKKSATYGTIAAILTALDTKTISDKLNIKNVEHFIKEMEMEM